MTRAFGLLMMAMLSACGSGGTQIAGDAKSDGGPGSDGDVGLEASTVSGAWETLPPMPDPARYYLGAAAVGSTIYAIGGSAGPGAVVQAFDTKSGAWQTLPPLSTRFVMPSVAAVGDRLFVLGGLQTTTVLELDDQGNWVPRMELPLAGGRGAAAVGVWNTKIVIAGGILPGQSNNMLDTGVRQVDVVAYDTATGTWQTLAPLPVAVGYAMGAVVGDKFWVIGGSTNDERTNVIHVLDLVANAWLDLPPIDRTLSSAAVGAVGDRIYMIGGIATSVGMVSPETFVFDPATSTLTRLAPVPTPRFAGAAAALGGRIYVVGGIVETSATDIHPVTTFEAFTP